MHDLVDVSRGPRPKKGTPGPEIGLAEGLTLGLGLGVVAGLARRGGGGVEAQKRKGGGVLALGSGMTVVMTGQLLQPWAPIEMTTMPVGEVVERAAYSLLLVGSRGRLNLPVTWIAMMMDLRRTAGGRNSSF